MNDIVNDQVEIIEKDPNLPNSLEEAKQRGYVVFHESPGLTPHVDNYVLNLRVKHKLRKYFECAQATEGKPCGETLPFQSPEYSGWVKKVYVCTGGNCSVDGYIAPAGAVQ